MSATPTTPAPNPARLHRRKIRAALAGGLVLGIGAAVTLAAWNDSEHATGTFAAGSFNLEGSTDGTTFADHAEAGNAAALSFAVAPDTMAPGDVVYAPFAVRLASGTTNDAAVTIAAAGTDGTVSNLSYALVSTDTFGCDADAVAGGTELVPAGTPLANVPGAPGFALTHADAAAGTPVNLCFAVTAGDIAQGQSGSATWEFAAESQS